METTNRKNIANRKYKISWVGPQKVGRSAMVNNIFYCGV